MNALVAVVALNQVGPPQHYIYQIIGSSRYLLHKVITQKIHVDMYGENIGGGGFYTSSVLIPSMKLIVNWP